MNRAWNNAADRRPTAEDKGTEPRLRVLPDGVGGRSMISSGIGPLDRRIGGLDAGGVYLISGTPGPAKLVASLQFLRAGIASGERVLFLSGIEASGLLEVARAWGSPMDKAWEEGTLEILGFRDDFEMRVLRSTEPEEALAELDFLVSRDVSRIAVDPGSMFLQLGGRSLLGRAFLDWARKHPATVCVTLSIDSPDALPSAADWLVHSTSGVFLIDRLPDGLLQVMINRPLPGPGGDDESVTLQLVPGVGLGEPERSPTRRRSDRPAGDPRSVLLLALGSRSPSEFENWARSAFSTEVVEEPLAAVTRLQSGSPVGSVLIHAPRQRLKEALQACRALRPLTAAAIVFASDDAVRSTDRVSLLEAGADDCLSGGIDFRELNARIRQAAAAGGKAAPPFLAVESDSKGLPGGRVSSSSFKYETERRGADPTLSVFGLLRFDSPATPTSDLERVLSEEIRDEDGDLVTTALGGCLVLLQGARWDSTQAFLARFRSSLEKKVGSDSMLRVEVMTHPAERDQILSILSRLNGPDETDASFPSGPGGSDGKED